ncbi:MAG: DUF362 domain-containing protein [Anaerolineales bacterium]
MSRDRVAITRVVEQRLDEAVLHAVELLGDLQEIIPSNSRVLIKPNFVFAPTDRGITHPELVEAVVRLVKETHPKEIVIAEGSADNYTTQSFRFQGVYRTAARYGARVVDLNVEEGVRTPVPEGLGRPHIMLPRAVVESDVFISLPVFKLWGSSPLSLSLKNLIGLYGGRYYGYNKDSDERGRKLSFYGLPGEVGKELGAHKPTVAQSICALNSVVETDLALIDALEGGDGAGNFIRLDTLIAGRNPVATDTVALEMTGLQAADYDITSLCAQRGLGPCRMEEIEVVGERVADVYFDLHRLRGNVLEMSLSFCLKLLSTGELLQIHRALRLYDFLPRDARPPVKRDDLLVVLEDILGADGYFCRALGQCNKYVRDLLQIIIAQGGTSGDMAEIEEAFCERWGQSGLYYMPSARILTRLGLAYAVDSASRNYYLLPEGMVAAAEAL